MHGCIPVVVQDGVSPPFHPHLDWASFSVRIAEADIPNTPDILLSIPPERVQELQVCRIVLCRCLRHLDLQWLR